MQTFLEFKTRLRSEMWPTGEAARLRVAHDPFFNEAMMDLQRWVHCLKQFNISTWNFADTYWENAKTVVNAPWGKIRRVYTVGGGLDRWRDKVLYRSSTFPIIQCWANTLYDAITPADGLPQLAFGVHRADASGDSTVGRARIGGWAVDRKRLYIAPYIQSTEMLVVDWDGEKSRWSDSDGVDETYFTVDVEAAIKYFVLFKHEILWGDRSAAKDYKALYDSALADLMHKCEEFTKQQHDHTCDASGGGAGDLVGLTADDIDDDDDPIVDPADDEVLFVHSGDLGEVNPNAEAVAEVIESDNPEALILGGDLTYGGSGDYATDFATNYQWALTAGIVYPCLGNHNVDATTSNFHTFFDKPGGRNYYEAIIGPIHFFFLNSDPREPDGISITSEQQEWLRLKALLSVARWKVVVMHHPPFSSGSTYGNNATLQWGFEDYGIHLVLASHEHNYERLEQNGIPYIVNGLGGKSIYPFGAPVSGSIVRYNSKYGRLIGEVNCDEMVLTFKSVDNDVIDTLTITHE